MMAAFSPTPGTSRAYILDKYFSELEKYWEDEKYSMRHQRSTEAERVTVHPTSASVISVPSRVSAPGRIGDRGTRIADRIGSAGSTTLSSDPTSGSATRNRIKSMQTLETLMAGGFPIRMSYRAFNIRYRCLAPFEKVQRTEEKTREDCELILNSFADIVRDLDLVPASPSDYAMGRTYIFLSEGTRQHLEMIRDAIRITAATSIQSFWRGTKFRREIWPGMKLSIRSVSISTGGDVNARNSNKIGSGSASSYTTGTGTVIVHESQTNSHKDIKNNKPRPQPIIGTPPPDKDKMTLDLLKLIEQTCIHSGLCMDHPPPIPPPRPYKVVGNIKIMRKATPVPV